MCTKTLCRLYVACYALYFAIMEHILNNVIMFLWIRFPKDPGLRGAWEHAVRRDGWAPKDGDRLCSAYFEAECFDKTRQTTRLRPGSLPTLFPAFPPHLQKPVSTIAAARSTLPVVKVEITLGYFKNTVVQDKRFSSVYAGYMYTWTL